MSPRADEVGLVRVEVILDGKAYDLHRAILEGDSRSVIDAVIRSAAEQMVRNLTNVYLPPSGIYENNIDVALKQMVGDDPDRFHDYSWSSLQDAYRLGRNHGRQEMQGDDPE